MSAADATAVGAAPGGSDTADVVVLGLGTMGSMAAWQLAVRGVRVIGLDQFGPLHSHGSFTGESRLFRVAAKEGRRYVPLLLRAREMWLELSALSGRDLFLPVGALSVGPADRPEMRETLAAIAEFDLRHEVIDAPALRDRFPAFRIEDDDAGILDLGGGGLRPELSVLSAQDLARAHGADLRHSTPVTGLEVGADGVVVHTDSGVVRAQKLVVAAGSWTPRVRPELGGLIHAQPLILTWFMPRHLELFTPDRFPVFMRDLGDIHAFGAPSLDGYAVKVCPEARIESLHGALEDLPREMDAAELARLGTMAQHLFPDLVPEPVHWSVHHDSYTQDKIPVMDLSADGRVVTLAGFSGHGFKFAPVVGQIAAELALDGRSALHDPLFSIAQAMHRAEKGAGGP